MSIKNAKVKARTARTAMKTNKSMNRTNQKYSTKRANSNYVQRTKRSLARSAAFTSAMQSMSNASVERAKAQTAQAQAMADLAKYNSLINGNQYGTNEVDPTKDGSKPRNDQNRDLVNPGGFND